MVKQHAFALELDVSFDPASHQGYVPCSYRGGEAGFEYLTATVAEYLAEQDRPQLAELRGALGDRDLAVSFLTRSRLADLKAATIAGAALATIADGLFWSDEADVLCGEPLALARDPEAVPQPPPPAAPGEPESVAVDLATRVVFRGDALTMLASVEETPRRFTVKVAVGEVEPRILALWTHAIGAPTVHRLRIGDDVHELDPKGLPRKP